MGIQTAMKYTLVLGQEYDRVPESGLLFDPNVPFRLPLPWNQSLGVVFAGG